MGYHTDLWRKRYQPSWFFVKGSKHKPNGPFLPRMYSMATEDKPSTPLPSVMCVAVLLKVCTGEMWAAHPQLHPAFMSLGVAANLLTCFRGGQNKPQQLRVQRDHGG